MFAKALLSVKERSNGVIRIQKLKKDYKALEQLSVKGFAKKNKYFSLHLCLSSKFYFSEVPGFLSLNQRIKSGLFG